MSDQAAKFAATVAARRRQADRGARMWSTAHHGSNSGSIVCSGIVSVIAASKAAAFLGYDATAVTAVLAGAAAALTAIGTFAGFGRKWRANRTTRTALDEMIVDLDDPAADLDALRTRYKQIIRDHDRAIQGSAPAGA